LNLKQLSPSSTAAFLHLWHCRYSTSFVVVLPASSAATFSLKMLPTLILSKIFFCFANLSFDPKKSQGCTKFSQTNIYTYRYQQANIASLIAYVEDLFYCQLEAGAPRKVSIQGASEE